jgi:hypothetical protein
MKNSTFFFLVLHSIILLFVPLILDGQKVINKSTLKPYLFPWAGGMNSVQFGELDINRDGVKDLVVFDRQGNRIMPFINNGKRGVIDYRWEPEYVANFPELIAWAIFVDFNNDGKSDIFTYSPGWAGMKVYKNISEDDLKFKLIVDPYLTSLYYGGEVNILVTYADYPAITDLDNDGDLDILTFWGLGSFVEMHKNMSMEYYGNADSLEYELSETCWGHFAESDESNQLYLDTCVTGRDDGCMYRNENRGERHTGSTFLMIDLDGDNDKDLLLGDVDYPGMFALYNGGTPHEAYITEIDTAYPDNETKIRIFSMPAAAYIDVNNDDKKDLLVSTFDPSPFISKNINNVFLYLNNGDNNLPKFELYEDDFLQKDMLDFGSGAIPVLFDWDGDGLKDLFVGNYGYYRKSWYDEFFILHSLYRSAIYYFKNTGTVDEPVFTPVEWDFGGFFNSGKTYLSLSPTFGDIDNDGYNEMIVGNIDGTLILCDFEVDDLIVTENYLSIDVGDNSVPQLFDLDKDGFLDLIIGNKLGKLSYYKNNGTAQNPNFVFITDTLGGVNVTDYNLSWYGYSSPCFFRLDDNVTRLIVGSEQGEIFYYVDIDNNLNGNFERSYNLGELIGVPEFINDRGLRTAVTMANIDNDPQPELIAGNFSGGLEFIGGNPDVFISVDEFSLEKQKIKITPNPAKNYFYVNIGSNNLKGVLRVLSVDGRIMMEKYFNGNVNIIVVDVTSLKKGFYLVNIVAGNLMLSEKLIIEK